MKTVTVVFEEPLHHVCLLSGLKQTYDRMPFLNKRVLEVRGKVMTIDNIVPPPPMMNNPSRRTGTSGTRNMVGVSYWKNKLSIEYREDMCSCEDITAFVNSLIEDYMHFRHPFMKTVTEDTVVLEIASRHRIAQIMY
ncbi:MAG: hypothetical protein E7117_10065 [Bacteroidales bacterium]|nr:hypothetical protein [Bacteroidales bacterium]